MTTKKTSKSRTKKNGRPLLVKVGKHYISPSDIRCITQVRKDLYVVKFYSDPNPEYPCWIESKYIALLLEQFNIIVSDE